MPSSSSSSEEASSLSTNNIFFDKGKHHNPIIEGTHQNTGKDMADADNRLTEENMVSEFMLFNNLGNK